MEAAETAAPSVATETVAAATASDGKLYFQVVWGGFRVHVLKLSYNLPVDAENITVEELRGLSDAVSSLRPKKVLNEELEELKEDREEYIHVS